MDVIVLAVFAVALFAILRSARRRLKFEARVNKISGPPMWPVIGNMLDIYRCKFDLLLLVEQLTQKNEHLFRFWAGSDAFVVTSRPEDIEVVVIILTSIDYIEKGKVYDFLHPWLGLGLLTSRGAQWHSRRKLITPSFHFKILDQFVDIFGKSSDMLAEKLLQQKEAINVQRFVTLCALDVICETAMGTTVEAQKCEESKYVTAVAKACEISNLRMMSPLLQPDFAFSISSVGKTYKKALQILHSYTRQVIRQRKTERPTTGDSQLDEEDIDTGIKKRTAFLDQLLNANDKAIAKLTDADIAEEVDTFMFEGETFDEKEKTVLRMVKIRGKPINQLDTYISSVGHDTTSSAITFTLYNIAAHPDVQEQLVEEMDAIFGDSDRAATAQDLQNMNYVERVIKESLRLYPSVPLLSRKVHTDLTLSDGTIVPNGCSIIVNCYMAGRNPKHWSNAEKFDPDRFLPERTTSRHPFAFVPFSAGPRNCIGQKFAMMELKSTISKVVRSCKLSLPYQDYRPALKGQLILKAPDGVILKVNPR